MMRIVKVFQSRDEKSLLASKLFDRIVADTPLCLDSLTFVFGSDVAEIGDGHAVVGFATDSIGEDHDERSLSTAIRLELMRASARINVPRIIGDVMAGKKMVKGGYGDDLAYMFFILMQKQSISTLDDYIRSGLPWVIFHGHEFYERLFKELLDRNEKFDAEKVFSALKRDLTNSDNLGEAICILSNTNG